MNTSQPIKPNLDESETIYGVFRLDIYHKPGWFLMNSYKEEQDADIYCDMLNADTNMVHRVFIIDRGE